MRREIARISKCALLIRLREGGDGRQVRAHPLPFALGLAKIDLQLTTAAGAGPLNGAEAPAAASAGMVAQVTARRR